MTRKEMIDKLKNTPRYSQNGKVFTPDQEVLLIINSTARLVESIEFGCEAIYINAKPVKK